MRLALTCRRLLTCALCLVLTGPGWAQQFDWLQTRPAAAPPLIVEAQAPDAQGGLAVVSTRGAFRVHASVAYGDVELLHYPAGASAPRFTQVLRGSGRALALHYTADGHLLLLGCFQDSLRLSPALVLRNRNLTPFLARFDTNGQLQWAHDLSQHLGADLLEVQTLATGPAGHIFLACQRQGAGTIPSTAVVRLAADGQGSPQVLLTQTRVSSITSLSCDARGNLLVAGACPEVDATYGGQAVRHPFDYCTYVARYSAAGRLRWVQFMEDGTCPNAQVVADGPAGFYYGAPLLFSVPRQIGPFSVMARSHHDYVVARLDSSGNWQWLRQLPSSGGGLELARGGRGQFMGLDGRGNVYLAGTCQDTIRWGGPAGTTATLPTSYDVAVVSYDRGGNLRWATVAGGDEADHAHSLAVAPAGSVFLMGYGEGRLRFGPLQSGTPGASHWFLTRLTGPTLASRPPRRQAGQLFPNPAEPDQSIHIQLPQAKPAALVQYWLRDNLGRTLRQGSWRGAAFDLPTQGLRAGTYLLTMQPTDEPALTQRLLVN